MAMRTMAKRIKEHSYKMMTSPRMKEGLRSTMLLCYGPLRRLCSSIGMDVSGEAGSDGDAWRLRKGDVVRSVTNAMRYYYRSRYGQNKL